MTIIARRIGIVIGGAAALVFFSPLILLFAILVTLRGGSAGERVHDLMRGLANIIREEWRGDTLPS